jgi:hypothetical protein
MYLRFAVRVSYVLFLHAFGIFGALDLPFALVFLGFLRVTFYNIQYILFTYLEYLGEKSKKKSSHKRLPLRNYRALG